MRERGVKLTRKLIIWIAFIMILCLSSGILSLPVSAATTPIIKTGECFPPNCYYHYDGEIWIYSTSKYKKEVKKAIRLMNKKYNVFRSTKKKNKCDVWIRDTNKPPKKKSIAGTRIVSGDIILYKKNMKRLSKADRILTIAHELGHTAGLAHSNTKKSLMYPYVDLMKAKKLSKADVNGLKKAKKYADKSNIKREKIRKAFLLAEQYGKVIRFRVSSAGRFVLTFPKRGTAYSSSDSHILKVYRTGVIDLKGFGSVTLTVKNAGIRHRFRIDIEKK